jgi:hypothetical protein
MLAVVGWHPHEPHKLPVPAVQGNLQAH